MPGREAVSLPRVILHLDMDAFYAAVEIREDPTLAGKPLIIGHPGRRGVVATCSYEARKFGVRSAMPSVTARRLCPDALWRPARTQLYSQISRSIRTLMTRSCPTVEPISIDEAFLDMTGLARELDHGARLGRELKARIVERHGLTASVGVAPNKFLAKLASDLDKPDGLVVFPIADVPSRLWPLPVGRLWGVGPRTADLLESSGLGHVGQLLEVGEEELSAVVGPRSAAHLRSLARGEDDRPVVARRDARSISEERTYGEDLTEFREIDRALLGRAEGVARQLRRKGLQAHTVHLKVRTGDFTTWTRTRTLEAPTDLAESIVGAVRALYRDRIRLGDKGVRLLGVGVSGLEPAGRGQGRLFASPGEEAARRRARATDAVRRRLGEASVTRARLLGRSKGKPADS